MVARFLMSKKMAEMNLKEIFRGKNELPKICYLCGKSSKELQEDHLPPKSIFPKQYWSKLITVPICNQCHDMRDKDDEYFRDYVTLWCGKNVPDEVHKRRQRSWDAHPAHKIGTMKNLTRIWRKLPSGLIVTGFELKGEMKRINPVLECIAKGHYFSCKDKIVPQSDIQILITKAPFNDEINEPEPKFWFPMTVQNEVIPGMFKFWFNHFQDGNVNILNWFLEFYNIVQLFVQFRWESI